MYLFSVRSRVLLSVVDDLESDEFIEPFPANNMFDPVDQLMPSMPTKNMAAENQTKNIISMETVAMEHRTNESQLVASAAWKTFSVFLIPHSS